MRKFVDENGKIITREELKKEFNKLKRTGETEAETFLEYVNNCTSKNGTLERVADDVWIKKLQHDVARDIACEEMPYGKCLEVLQKYNWFGNWTAWEINHRPVDIDEVREMVEQELGLQ